MNKLDKPKRTSEELIGQLKEKGVKFDIITEADAAVYIKDINNYLRTASYRKTTKSISLVKTKENILVLILHIWLKSLRLICICAMLY